MRTLSVMNPTQHLRPLLHDPKRPPRLPNLLLRTARRIARPTLQYIDPLLPRVGSEEQEIGVAVDVVVAY